MGEVCAGPGYSFDDASEYVSAITQFETPPRPCYVIAAACAGCRAWHIRLVEHCLTVAD